MSGFSKFNLLSGTIQKRISVKLLKTTQNIFKGIHVFIS